MISKKIILFSIFILLFNFSAQAQENKDKCLSVKGVKEKIKCIKDKYESWRESVPKTGADLLKKAKN
tara:strand:- start:19 stop:219 length:201 start_codon:yes stop_codon:yes gene_type:complete